MSNMNSKNKLIVIGLIILTISIGYIFVNKEIPYLCNRGIETLCGL